MATVQDKIAGLYAAFFNRAPDKAGFDEWVIKLEDGISTLEDISAGFAGHPVFSATYGSMDDTAFVNAIYTNMLGSAADVDGLAYYTNKLATVEGYDRSDMVAEFIGGVLDADVSSKDLWPSLTQAEFDAAVVRQNLMKNKVAVSKNFMEQLAEYTNVQDGLNPESDAAYIASQNILSGVTADAATVATANNLIATLATEPSIAIATINKIVETNGSITDDATVVDNAQTAVNTAPVLSALAPVAKAENVILVAGTVVATAAATDVDGQTLTYSISGDSRFAINATTGAITVVADTTFDYETETSVALTVSATDGITIVTTPLVVNVVDEAATYTLTADEATAKDGDTVSFTFTAVESGITEITYTITGVTADKVVGGAAALTGTATVLNGEAIVNVTLLAGTSVSSVTATSVVDGHTVSATTSISSGTVTSANISLTDIVTANNDFITKIAGDSGTYNLNIASSSAVAPTVAKVVVSGDANLNITSGSGDDNIIIDGAGNNIINDGDGADDLVLGNGNNVVIIGDGEYDVGSSIIAGTGVDTIKVSGTNTLAAISGVENLVIQADAVVTMSEDLLTEFDSIVVNGTTTELSITNGAQTSVDLTGVLSGTLAELALAGSVVVTLDANQISHITAVTGAGSIATSIDGAIAASHISITGVTVTISDSIENIIARGSELSGVTIALTQAVDVAGANEILASGLTVSYDLIDTADNLAKAPQAVFNSAVSVEVTTVATAAQAVEIDAMLDTAVIAAVDVEITVSDTASMLANQASGLAKATEVIATTSATTAEAIAIYTANTAAEYAITDAAATVAAAAAQNALDHATSITLSNAATVAQIGAINAGSDVDVTIGYELNDTFAAINAAAPSVKNSAGNIVVNDASITVANALTIEAINNTGTNSYVIEDAIATLLAANSAVVANASAVSTNTVNITVAQMNSLVNKYGTTKLADANVTVQDTAANMLNLSANGVAEANAISVTGTVTAQQLVDLKALLVAKMPNVNVADSAVNLLAGIMDLNDSKASTISVTGEATIEQIQALDAGRWVNTIKVQGTYTVNDTAAHLVVAASAGAGADTINDALANAANVVVSDATTVANIGTINGVASLVLGTTLTYSLSDSASAILGGAGTTTAATTVSITDTSVNFADAESLVALANFDDVYTIVDTVTNLFGETSAADQAVLNGAVSVTLKDTVANLGGANGQTAMALNTTDTVIAEDTLANLSGASSDFKASVDSFVVTNAAPANELTVSDAATVNALAALKPTVYAISDAYADMVTGVTAAVATMVAGASVIKVDADADNTLDVLSVLQFNTLDALTTASIQADITDTIANLSSATGSAAIAAAQAASATITISDTNATVDQIQALQAKGLSVAALTVVDTAAHISAATDTLLAAVSAITVSDNGETTLSKTGATEVYTVDGSAYANYNLVDSAANLVAAISANVGLANFASSVTANTAATVAQATTLATTTTMGTTTYSIADSAANLAGAPAATLNSALNLSANTAATVAEAVTITAATNSGSTSFDVSDTAAQIASTGESASQKAIDAVAIEAATGTVTATGNATAVEASYIAALTKAVVYNVSDTATAVAASTGLNEAVNVATTGTATVAEANTVMAATNSGTTTLNAVSGIAAQVKTLVLGSNDTITTVTVTGTTSTTDATAIAALDTGANIGTLTINAISGTTVELLATTAAVLNLGTTVTATTAMTLAQKTTLAGTVDVYSLTDSYANLMENSDVAGDVDADAAITGATTVTITDASLTIAQAVTLLSVSVIPDYVYNIVDTDANIVTAMTANPTALANAASVKGFDGIELTFDTVNATFSLVGTKAELDALSDILQTADKVYEVSVADLEADSNFYSSLDATQAFRITDTAANLTGGSAFVPMAAALVVSDDVTMAQITAIASLNSNDNTYNLADLAANLVAGATLNGATNVTALTAATFAQAEVIIDAGNSGTTTYDISDTDLGYAVDDNANGARNITVVGTVGISHTNAQTLIDATNSGTTTIAKVTGTSAQLAAMTKGTNDTITLMVPSNDATVAQAGDMKALATSVTYNLSDTATALAEASSAVLNGATVITATGNATVAEATILDAATASDANTSFSIADTAASLMVANTALLAKDANDVLVITDASIAAADATALRAFDTANTGFTVVQAGAAGVFTISDTSANILATANATAVAASTDVRVTDTISVATALLVNTAAAADATPVYNVSDTYANLVINQAAVTDIAVNIIVSNQLNVAQAVIADGFTNTGSLTFSVTDTAAKVAAGVGTVSGATTVSLTNAATVAEAAYLSEMTNLAAGYTISDTAANVQAALDTANANGVGSADRDTILSATSITLTSSATVAEAVGVLGTESRGLYTVDGLTYTITDTGAAMATALAGIDAEGITSATSLYLNGTTGVSVANMTALLALDNFVGHDQDANASTAARYYIEDTAVNIAVATTELIDGAYSVVANGTTGDDVINLSMFTDGITILAGTGNDTITGTDGADTISGEGGSNIFVFSSGSGTTAVIDIVTDFVSGTDTIKTGAAGTGANFAADALTRATLADALTAANSLLDSTVMYVFTDDVTATAADSYLFIDWDLDGTADQIIQFSGIATGDLVSTDIIV